MAQGRSLRKLADPRSRPCLLRIEAATRFEAHETTDPRYERIDNEIYDCEGILGSDLYSLLQIVLEQLGIGWRHM